MQTMGPLYQDRTSVLDGTPPAQATNEAIQPETSYLHGMIAGEPSTFAAHGVGGDTLGSYPGGGRATLIPSMLAGPQVVSPARTRDGYTLRGPGTPEPAINAPARGAVIEYGMVKLGFGPAIPLLLVALAAGAYIYTRKG